MYFLYSLSIFYRKQEKTMKFLWKLRTGVSCTTVQRTRKRKVWTKSSKLFLVSLSNLFETGSLPFQFSNKSNIFSMNFERSKNFDFSNSWRIDWENFLNPDTVNILTNCNGFIKSCFSMSLDNKTFEFLDTFLVSFFDNLVYFHFHTSSNFRSLILDGFLLNSFNKCCVHSDNK